MPPAELLDKAVTAAVAALLGGGGVFAVLVKRSASPSDLVTAAAALQRELSAQGLGVIGELRQEVEGLRGEMAAMKLAHAREMADLNLKHVECQNENLQLVQQYESLCGYLRRQGLDVPTRKDARPFVVLEHGEARPSIINAMEEPGNGGLK